jgi:ligand-binding sensor domain-containing protein
MRRKSNGMKFILISGFLLVSCLAAPQTQAWKKSLRFERLAPEDGLSDIRVDSIAQDQQGFMWFGAVDGLNKYDGYNFTLYAHDPDDPTSISGGQIMDLLVDSKGVLWVASEYR